MIRTVRPVPALLQHAQAVNLVGLWSERPVTPPVILLFILLYQMELLIVIQIAQEDLSIGMEVVRHLVLIQTHMGLMLSWGQ